VQYNIRVWIWRPAWSLLPSSLWGVFKIGEIWETDMNLVQNGRYPSLSATFGSFLGLTGWSTSIEHWKDTNVADREKYRTGNWSTIMSLINCQSPHSWISRNSRRYSPINKLQKSVLCPLPLSAFIFPGNLELLPIFRQQLTANFHNLEFTQCDSSASAHRATPARSPDRLSRFKCQYM
jgi:hypothetical protein